MSFISRTAFTFCLLLCLPVVLHAAKSPERNNFLKAEKAINKGDLKTWQRLQPKLVDYPLYADLLYKRAMQTIDSTSPQQANDKLQALADTPLHKIYLKSWLRLQASKRRWKQYIADYQHHLGTRYQCHYAEALYATDQKVKALDEATKLWLVGKSQPKHCDPVFKAMKKNGQLTDVLVWQRIELAIRKGKTSLVKYLKKSLPAYDQKMVDEWLRIRYKPERALAAKYLQSEIPRRQQMLVYGIKRMALFEADRALKEWQKVRNKVLLGEEDKQDIERYIALRMTTQRIDGAVAQHKRITNPDRDILEWGVRAALRESDWQAVGGFIRQMGDIDELPERWQYWMARYYEVMGKQNMADSLYHVLASGRGYHNFLAADQVGTAYLFNNKPLQYTADEIDTLVNNYNVRRAKELYELDRLPEARREWYFLIRHYGDEDRQKLAWIQKQWGWHSQAILTIATADYYDDLGLRFPVVYKKELEKATTRNGLDTAWVMALMRQESAFQPDARSSAGARGLMQVMPTTGRYVARLLKLRRPKVTDLYKPTTNIKLGTHYLKKNLNDFNQNKVLTTAAYNAGPSRVNKWLPENSKLDADVWTETIPFKETRGYVQRIMSYASIYDHKLGYDVKRLHQRMQGVDTRLQTASNP